MTTSKSTRYALCAMLDLAREVGADQVSVARIARRHGIPETALAKVFQRLVRSGLVVGVRGVRGGYRLARRSSDITVLDVLDAFEPVPERTAAPAWEVDDERLRDLFGEINERVRAAFASVTLEALADREAAAPHGVL